MKEAEPSKYPLTPQINRIAVCSVIDIITFPKKTTAVKKRSSPPKNHNQKLKAWLYACLRSLGPADNLAGELNIISLRPIGYCEICCDDSCAEMFPPL